jgi:hypothetical protein
VPTAIDVLTTGSYIRLPTCIRVRFRDSVPSNGSSDILSQEIVPQPNAAGAPEAIEQLNTLLHMRLFSSPVPVEVTEIKVANGILTMRVPGEFQVGQESDGPS